MTAYKPEAEVFTSGGPFVMLTARDGSATVDLYLTNVEARELAAAIEHTADMAARGTEHAVSVAISP